MVRLWTWIYDETGMPWHSGSSVLGARCWPVTSAKPLELCSSWGMAPLLLSSLTLGLSLYSVTPPDLGWQCSVTWWDCSPALQSLLWMCPWFGVGNEVVGAPQPAQHHRGRNMKFCLHSSGVPETVGNAVGTANGHCSIVMFRSDLRGRYIQQLNFWDATMQPLIKLLLLFSLYLLS